LRHWALPFTESMDPPLRDKILESLFPIDGGEITPWEEPPLETEGGWREEWGVQEEELRDAIKRMRAKNKAPVPVASLAGSGRPQRH